MSLCNEIRKLMIDCDVTLTQLAQEISRAKNKHYTVQNLSQKLKNNTLNAQEVDIILELVGWGFYPNNKICYKIRT